jgi:hypothetical protein
MVLSAAWAILMVAWLSAAFITKKSYDVQDLLKFRRQDHGRI